MTNGKKETGFSVTFYGAALEVTGSCHLLQANGKNILLDCGMRQGGSTERRTRQIDFEFDPGDIDMVVLSHGHLDHSGALPKLVHAGFKGPIYCTSGTKQLLKILLEDSFNLYKHDLQWRNKQRARSGEARLEPVYTAEDVENVLELCRSHRYNSAFQIAKGIDLQFFNAGHILGSAIVELKLEDAERTRSLVFSGDLGNPGTSLMPEPSIVDQADLVLLESTYGDRNHRSLDHTITEFQEVIARATRQKGSILIPAFAVGRTQELLFQLGCLYQQGKLHGWRVFLDSPMAAAVTEIYNRCINRLDKRDIAMMRAKGCNNLHEFLPILTICETVEESMMINEQESKVIVIAGSGMCTGGRIRHHFKQRIWQENTHILFVGFQAAGTLGRRLVEGAETVSLFRQEYKVAAEIHTIGGFSAHAGQDDLIQWASNFPSTSKFCLVHGERKAVVELSNQLKTRLGYDAEIAVQGASVFF